MMNDMYFDYNKSFNKFLVKVKNMLDDYKVGIDKIIESENYLCISGYRIDNLGIYDDRGNVNLNLKIRVYGIKQEDKEKYVDFEFNKKIKGLNIFSKSRRIKLKEWGPDNYRVIGILMELMEKYWTFEKLKGEVTYRKAYLIKEEERFWNSMEEWKAIEELKGIIEEFEEKYK